MFARSRRLVATMSVAAALTLSLAACSSDDGTASGSSGGGADTNKDVTSGVTKDDAAAKQVPKAIADKGKILVGTDASYAPNEFVDADGSTIIGMDIDLGTAIGAKLGIKVEFQNAKFDTLIAALGSKYDIGMSSFTDNKDREQQVDMVTYFSAGTSWAEAKGSDINIEDACGKNVAVQTGTVQETEDLPARQKKCEAAGKDKIEVQSFASQADATTAVVGGKSDAMLADSPVVAYAISQTDGALKQAGETYGAAPYGIAVPKSAGTMKEAILAALKSLIADGTYKKILAKWGVEGGGITDPVINGATS